MRDVGLGYLTLGQPLSTLSGRECQRIRLAREVHKDGSICVMDEPTTGLHMSDLTHLLTIMDRVVDDGNSVIVIEHNLDVMRNANWKCRAPRLSPGKSEVRLRATGWM